MSSTPVSSPSNTVQRTSYGDLINALPNLLAALDFSNLDPSSHKKTGADRSQAKSALAYRSPDTGYGVPVAPVITSNAVEPSTGYGVPAAAPINYFTPAPLDSYGAPQAAPLEDGYGSPAYEQPAPAYDYDQPAPSYGEPASTYEIRPLPVPSNTSCHSPPPGWECSYQTTTETECETIFETIYEEIEDENGKQCIASLGSLLKEINVATPSLPPGLSNPTSSEDLKILEPPADAQDKDAPRRFVFQDMRDFSPRGSFGFLAVNSSYRPYFPQGGGTKVT